MTNQIIHDKIFAFLKFKEATDLPYSHYLGGSGGKGTWGGLLDTDDTNVLDPNDPNYDSSEVRGLRFGPLFCSGRVCLCNTNNHESIYGFVGI